jgi:hypothetical protein
MHPDVRDDIRSRGWVDYTAAGKNQFWRSYIMFAKWFFQYDTRLYLLSTAKSLSKPQEIPSWCPNWAFTQKERSLQDFAFYCSGYRDIESRRSRVSVLVNSNKTRVPGFRIDTIDEVVEPWPVAWATPNSAASSQDVAANLLEWESTCLQLSQKVCNSEVVPEAHRRTLIGDGLFADSDGFVQACDEDPKNNYDLWKHWLAHLADSRRSLLVTHAEQEAINSYHDANKRMCYGRAFFSTSRGRIGLGAPDVMKGDVVCVFYSGGPLYVIRFQDRKEEGKDVELIGEAYVHDLMREGLALDNPDRGSDENFYLI